MSGETTWKMVPAEATENQYEAMRVLAECSLEAVGKFDCSLVYATGVSAAPKPAPGLYVVSEDGTARRVEVDVVGALNDCLDEIRAWRKWADDTLGRGAGPERPLVTTVVIRNVNAALRALTGEER